MYSILYFTSLIEQSFPLSKTIFFGLLVAAVWYNHDWNVLILDQLELFAAQCIRFGIIGMHSPIIVSTLVYLAKPNPSHRNERCGVITETFS